MQLRIISVPYDSGIRDARMGAGPPRLLAAGLVDSLRRGGHGVRVEEGFPPPAVLSTEIGTAFGLNGVIAEQVREAIAAGEFPIIVAGNCITAVGVLAGLGIDDICVLWFDVHGDFNTPETTIGGFLDGMALSVVTGHCWTQLASRVVGFRPTPERNVILFGARDVDELEERLLADSAVTMVPSSDVITRLPALLRQASRPLHDVYLHIDLDVLDPSEGRANTFATDGGLSMQNLESALRVIGRECRIRGASVTAYDPSCDDGGRICVAAMRLIGVIAELAAAPEGTTRPPGDV